MGFGSDFCGKVWRTGSFALIAAGVGCGSASVVVVSPYDAPLDEGLQDFKEKLSLLVVDAGSKTGPEGSFDAYKQQYAGLEVKLVLLRQRASVLEAEDTQCDVSPKLKELVARMPHGGRVLQAFSAVTPQAADAKAPVPVSPLAIGKHKGLPPAVGCMTHLLDNVAAQLTAIETIHSDPRHCAAPNQPELTCLRPAAALGALAPASDSIDAALLVQIYKKKAEEPK